jgi:hypothetical protein
MGQWRQRWEALLPLAIAAFLIVLALPRLVSSVIMLPVEPIMDALQAGRPVSDEDLQRFASRSAAARRFSSAGRLATDLAAAKLAQAERLPTRAQSERRELVEDAAALLEEGLAATPANSFAWARLAYARTVLEGPGAGAVDAWRMSVLTAPAETRLTVWRTRLGVALLAQFREGDRDLLDRQIRFAWRSDPERLAAFAKSGGPETIQLIRIALLDEPGALQKFDAALGG